MGRILTTCAELALTATIEIFKVQPYQPELKKTYLSWMVPTKDMHTRPNAPCFPTYHVKFCFPTTHVIMDVNDNICNHSVFIIVVDHWDA